MPFCSHTTKKEQCPYRKQIHTTMFSCLKWRTINPCSLTNVDKFPSYLHLVKTQGVLFILEICCIVGNFYISCCHAPAMSSIIRHDYADTWTSNEMHRVNMSHSPSLADCFKLTPPFSCLLQRHPWALPWRYIHNHESVHIYREPPCPHIPHSQYLTKLSRLTSIITQCSAAKEHPNTISTFLVICQNKSLWILIKLAISKDNTLLLV